MWPRKSAKVRKSKDLLFCGLCSFVAIRCASALVGICVHLRITHFWKSFLRTASRQDRACWRGFLDLCHSARGRTGQAGGLFHPVSYFCVHLRVLRATPASVAVRRAVHPARCIPLANNLPANTVNGRKGPGPRNTQNDAENGIAAKERKFSQAATQIGAKNDCRSPEVACKSRGNRDRLKSKLLPPRTPFLILLTVGFHHDSGHD
jgi:hypothetical protein